MLCQLRGIRSHGALHRTTTEGRGARAQARRGHGGGNQEQEKDARGAEQSARQQQREGGREKRTTTKVAGGERNLSRFCGSTLNMQRCLRHVVAAFHRIKPVYHKCKKRARLSSPASFSASPLHTSVRELNVRRRAARSAGGPRERNSRPGLRIISRLSTVGVCTSDVLVERGASSLPRLPERHAGTVHARLGLEVDHARLHQAWQHH